MTENGISQQHFSRSLRYRVFKVCLQVTALTVMASTKDVHLFTL
jgi:hypothetical protein